MSALATTSAAILKVLRDAPGLAALNRVGGGEGERAPVPAAWISEASESEWGAKLPRGCEVRLVIALADRGDPARLEALLYAAEAALAALPRPLAGWDHAGPRLRRTRLLQRRDGTRVATIELALRMLAAD